MDTAGKCMFGFIALVISMMVWGMIVSIVDHRKMMDECMNDGKKQYECKMMLSGNRIVVQQN